MVTLIKNYLFIKKIGQGSYGEVWLVHKNDNQHKKFVLKKISFARASEREMEAARQECQLLKNLEHPNIVQYKDSFEEGNSLYIAMSFCEEGDLYTRLKERKGEFLTEKQIVEWLIQLTMALSYIHGRNILHRDLKTQNVFLSKSIIKVGDLGIAKQLENKFDMAETIIGTPYYMSPELFAKKPYNFKSDIWSLGCIAFEMVTLKHAFNAKNYTALSYKILMGHTPDMPAKYSKDLISLIEDMLNKRPEKRPHTNKILSNPYIRKHIQIFVENSRCNRIEKTRKSDSKNQHRQSQNSPKSSFSKYRQRKNSELSSDESRQEDKIIPAVQSKHCNKEYDDNDDIVIVRSSNESQSKKSSVSSQKENYSQKSSSTDSDKKKPREKKNEEEVLPIENEEVKRSKSMFNLDKGEPYNGIDQVKETEQQPLANLVARKRRRQKKRDQGFRTLLIPNDENDDRKEVSNSNSPETPNEIGMLRQRRRNKSSDQINHIVLPELRRVDPSEEQTLVTPCEEVLQVADKMNESLSFNGLHNFANIKDSILMYKNQVDSVNAGPIEDEQETLDRTKWQNKRYQEIRKELMNNVGYQNIAKCYEVLRDLDLNHDFELRKILGDKTHDIYAGKIIWLKMTEEGD